MAQATERTVSRRGFVKGSTLSALAAMAGAGAASSLFGCAPQTAEKGEDLAQTGTTDVVANDIPEEGEVIWQSCCHCGFVACPLKCHVVDGTLRWVDNDTEGDDEFGGVSFRSCLKARSVRKWINSPDRLKYPMKRTGKRGSGEFERISWDEALDIIAEKYRYTLDTYGPEAFFLCATGTRNYPIQRLFNLTGGHLGTINSESNGQIAQTANYLFGFDGQTFDCAGGLGSNTSAIKDADCGLFFGCGSGESRMCGMGEVYEVAKAREAGIPVAFVDYRLGEGSSGNPDEWFPIYPGTDGALASAIAYVIISEGKHDKAFLDKYVVGFDADTMPESAPANSSYMDYIMGTGYDNIPKTPEWAAPICGLPSEKITYLAHFITDHETCFITQGFGPQRRHNGEWNAAAIAALPVITGNIGRAGTCPGLNGKGMQMNFDGGMWNSVPIGENPVTKKISISGRFNAMDHPLEMTALTDGIQGGDKLEVGIKFLALYEAGCFGNSSSDLNWAATILEDESKCEFILGCDVIMSTSLPFCDIILPDLMYQERMNMVSTVTGGSALGFVSAAPCKSRSSNAASPTTGSPISPSASACATSSPKARHGRNGWRPATRSTVAPRPPTATPRPSRRAWRWAFGAIPSRPSPSSRSKITSRTRKDAPGRLPRARSSCTPSAWPPYGTPGRSTTGSATWCGRCPAISPRSRAWPTLTRPTPSCSPPGRRKTSSTAATR